MPWTIKHKTMIGIAVVLGTIVLCYAYVDVENELKKNSYNPHSPREGNKGT